MNSKKIKITDLSQNYNTELLEEITKEKLEKINGGRWCMGISIGGAVWDSEIWVY
jgi:hypothetical protein